MPKKKDLPLKDYISIIKGKDKNFLVKWHQEANFYTLEDVKGEHVVVFGSSINNLEEEIEKLQELMHKPEKRAL